MRLSLESLAERFHNSERFKVAVLGAIIGSAILYNDIRGWIKLIESRREKEAQQEIMQRDYREMQRYEAYSRLGR